MNINGKKLHFNAPIISSFINIGSIDGGIDTKVSGTCVIPIGIPIIVVAIIPINTAPLTFLDIKKTSKHNPIIVSNTAGVLISPIEIEPSTCIIPPFLNPSETI